MGPPGLPAIMVKLFPRRSMRIRTRPVRSLLASCFDSSVAAAAVGRYCRDVKPSPCSATSPDSFFQANWKASVLPQILAPPPVTRYWPEAAANSAFPFAGVTPTSLLPSNCPTLWAQQTAAAPQKAKARNVLLVLFIKFRPVDESLFY